MEAEYLKLYSKTEQERMKALDKLFRDWKKVVGDPTWYWFIPDGFYPKYLSQTTRILYIARDSYDLYGDEDENGERTYIEKFIRQYLAGRMDNNGNSNSVNINRNKFHKMLIQVAYGLINDFPWSANNPKAKQVLSASEICEGGKVFERATFAFMNLCKWSHENGEEADKNKNENNKGWKTDWTAVKEFVEKSATKTRNFFLEEINLLDPNIIITLNLRPNLIAQWTGHLAKRVEIDENCCVYRLSSGDKERMIFDSWHFSTTRKSEERDIYNPLLKMTRKWYPR